MDDKVSKNIKISSVNPKSEAGFFSTIFFCWTLPIFRKGYRKEFEEEDLYNPLKEHESGSLGDKLEAAWKKEILNHQNPSLWRAMIRVFYKDFLVLTVAFTINEILKIYQVIALGKLVTYFSYNKSEVSNTEGYINAAVIAGIAIANTLIIHNYIMNLQHLGMKLRIATCSLIYRKSLKLSHAALGSISTGQFVNLLSNDVNRFDTFVIHLNPVFLALPLLSIVVVLIQYYCGWIACAGILLFLLFVPFQMLIAKKISNFRFGTALRTDERVRLMNEIITGLKVIKMYTWEEPFSQLVAKTRKSEIHQIRGSSYLRGTILSLTIVTTRTALFISYLTYALLGNNLSAQYVYLVTGFYNSLRLMMSISLPFGMNEIAEANISVRRIQKVLMMEEKDQATGFENGSANGKSNNINIKEQISGGKPINIKAASAKWDTSSTMDDTLTDITLNVGKDELIGVVGPVGSGKSTLLQMILKELPVTEGTVSIRGSISYAPQEAWLFTGSVRQNILFGQPYEEKRYNEVVKVCCLERDFSLFPYGDKSIVGERGVMLSGGQKARINLARAVYKNSDIYLLDDPLSAVDAHVGRDLFDNCITKYLRGKCVILITHQLQYLGNVNKIILMDNGRIAASGTYQELQAHSYFEQLLQEEQKEEEPETSKTEEDLDEKKEETKEGPTVAKETRSFGKLSSKIYSRYCRAGGGIHIAFGVMSLFVIGQLLASGSDYFITFWVNLEQRQHAMEQSATDYFFTRENCAYIYAGLILVMIVMVLFRSYSFFSFCLRSSKNLHNEMFSKIVYASMRFFNTNPSGRILNRFSKDTGAVDEVLPATLLDTIQIGLTFLGIVILTTISNYVLLVPLIIVIIIFYFLRSYYMATSRNVKRLEGITKSPVFTHINATLQGLTTIRAFGAQEALKQEFDHFQNAHSSAFFIFLSCTRAFGFWLDGFLSLYITVVTFSYLVIGSEYAGNVGLGITQTLGLLGMVQWGMRQWSETENQMTSVERIIEYTDVIPEKSEKDDIPPKEWPAKGEIEFKAVSLKYSENDPYVLKNLNFIVKPREKIGIVGRTGAGKSSLIVALFQLEKTEGEIIIDGINTKMIKLNSLRNKISIIPQEPVLFSGSLRKNLDPFDHHNDEELWNALEQVELKSVVAEFPAGLEHKMSEGGSNLSVGQRQLLCLARAIIRQNKILVLDEATANVDHRTDELIQYTIRQKFADCTVLTIAHRLQTVMDSDQVLVMEAGEAVEFGPPHVLLQSPNGMFRSLVMQTGKGMSENLLQIAKHSFEESEASTSESKKEN